MLLAAASALLGTDANVARAEPAQGCSTALHSAQSVAQWQVNIGTERMTTRSATLPPDRTLYLEIDEVGLDVDLEVSTPTTATEHAGSPVPRHGVVRAVLHTDRSGQVTFRIHTTLDGGVGRHVTVRAYDEAALPSAACQSVLGALAAGDGAFARAQQVLAGHATPNSGSAAADYASARRHYADAFAALTSDNVSLRAEVARTLAALACENMDQWQECEQWSALAAEQYAVAGDAQGRANAQSLQALAWLELAELPDAATAADAVRRDSRIRVRNALHQLRELAAFYLRRGEPHDAAEQLNLAGITLYNAGDYGAALATYGRAQRLYERSGDRYRLALALQNIALAEWDLGRASAALGTFQRALGLVTVAEAPRLYALILDNAGLANRTAGHLDAALAMHAQALELATQSQDGSERGRSLFGIGMVYSAAGDRGLAATFLHQALDTLARGGEGRDSVSVLRALAMIEAQDGHPEEAVRLDREALARATGPIVRTRLLAQIADCESLLGRNQAATDDLALAAKIPAASDKVSRAAVELERGVLEYRTGRLAEARARLKAALATDRAFGLDAASFDAQVALARVDAAAGRIDLALGDLDAGLELSEVLRVQVSDPELRATSMQPLRPAFDLKVDLLASAYEQAHTDGNGRDAEPAARAALAVTERSRARVMQDIAVADYTQGDERRVDQLLSRKSRLLGDLAAHEDRLEAGGTSSAADPRATAIRTDVAHLRAQLAVLDSQLAIAARSGAARFPRRTAAPAAPPAGVALLSYWVGPSKAYVWLQTRSALRLIDLGSADALRRAADAAHAAYRDPEGSSMQVRLQAGAALSRLVLQPALAQLPPGILRLVIIPDGPLHYISFAALPIRAEALDSFLVEKYDVAYGSSIATVLATGGAPRPTQERMLLVADAVYGADDPRLKLAAGARPALATARARLRSAVTTDALERLPATAVEATGIARLAAPLAVDSLTGFEATREAVLSRPLERYRYIHFAVHATTDAEIPQLSSLLLSGYDAAGRSLESRIWAGDLMTKRFNAQTVVLSACQTALGRDIGGEGLFSLRYVVLARGAQSVIASLWSVPDRSTSTLMQSFYKALLNEHRRPESALTLAIRQMLEEGPRDPFFWAPFTATVASLQ